MIIFLNGVSASGKTSIIQEIQHNASFPVLKLGVDSFVKMLPSDYFGWGSKAAEGIQFIREETERGPMTKVTNGPLGKTLLHAIPGTIAQLAYQGLNIACDEVLFYDYYLKLYTQAFKGHKAYFIGVHCDLDEIIRREEEIGGRSVGLGRSQLEMVHGPTRFYDLEINTTRTPSRDCARQILSFIETNPNPEGFKKLEIAFKI